MKYCLLADVHGNLPALEAVLAEAQRHEPERYICAGDIVGYGADPGPCIERLRELETACVAGNHDWAAIGLADSSFFNPDARRSVQWTADALSAEQRQFLERLPLTLEIDGAVVAHGSVTAPEEFLYILSLGDAEHMMARQSRPLGVIGHSHVPGVFRMTDALDYDPRGLLQIEGGMRAIINVGSVGQPRDGDSRAAYAIYDADAGRVEVFRVEYDWRVAAERIMKSGLPMVNAIRLGIGQ